MTRLAANPVRRRKPARISYEHFLCTYCSGEHVEWVDGYVVPMAPVTSDHCDYRGTLLCLVGIFAEVRQPGVIYGDPFQMKTGPLLPGRQPDLFYASNRHRHRCRPMYFDGPADLVVEVIGPGTRALDRWVKFEEYQAGGVPEYWVVDSVNRKVEFFRLGRDRQYRRIPPEADGATPSRVLHGFWLRPEWLWGSVSFIDAYRELGLI